jgi:hypothetical protein
MGVEASARSIMPSDRVISVGAQVLGPIGAISGEMAGRAAADAFQGSLSREPVLRRLRKL